MKLYPESLIYNSCHSPPLPIKGHSETYSKNYRKKSYQTVSGDFETVVEFFYVNIAVPILITMPFVTLKVSKK